MKSTSKMLKGFLGGGLILLALFALVGRAIAQVCVPPPSGMVSWWPGDGNANDIISGNNGTLSSGVTFGSGEVGQAFSVHKGDAIVVPHYANLAFGTNQDFTIDAWVNLQNPLAGFDDFVVSKWDVQHFRTGVTPNSYELHLQRDTHKVVLQILSNNVVNILVSSSAVPLGQWTHVAAARAGSTGLIYINGVLDASATMTAGTVANSDPLTIGAIYDTSQNPPWQVNHSFGGLIDEVEVFNRALSAAEVATIFAAGSAGKCKPGAACLIQPSARAYVPNARSNSVSVIDIPTNTVLATIPVGANPVNVAVTPDGGRAYVANAGSNSVSVINTGTNTVVATVLVGANPVNIAITPNGASAYVANAGASSVTVINTATNTVVATIPVGPNPAKIAITANGASAYVTDAGSNTVSVINTATNTVTATVLVGFNPVDVAIH